MFEQDILSSVITVKGRNAQRARGKILDLGIEVYAERGAEAPEPGSDIKVLDWQLAVLVGGGRCLRGVLEWNEGRGGFRLRRSAAGRDDAGATWGGRHSV